jgi:tetratricopeptide (TPR) repeat protein
MRAYLLARSVIERAERGGSPRSRAAAYWNAALVADARGEMRTAKAMTERALALYGEVGNAWAVASLRVNCAWLMLRMPEPDHAEATRLLERALASLPEVGTAADVASAETELARCRLFAGDAASAIATARGALARVEQGPHLEAARARVVLADALFAEGDVSTAVTTYTEAAVELEQVGATRQAAAVWRQLADALASLGATADAMVAYRRVADAAGIPGRPPAPAGDSRAVAISRRR